MAISGDIDPRRGKPQVTEADVRPVVARPRRGLPTIALVALALICGLALFAVLDARRRALSAPQVTVPAAPYAETQTVPPLYVPYDYGLSQTPYVHMRPRYPSVPYGTARLVSRAPVQSPQRQSQSPPTPAVATGIPVTQPPRRTDGAPLVVDVFANQQGANPGAPGDNRPGLVRPGEPRDRVRASMLANRSTTVAQGTLIQGVLETALDSTHPGFARAIVQQDIRSFDGSQVLIPRGSRLIGEYRSNAAAGQKRLLVNWTRLIRPDGVTIQIDSPLTDTLGRGGARASVNTHFFERFAGAILQSALDIGVNLAARSDDGPTVIALPGSFQGANALIGGRTQVMPTLRVRQGSSISVFVARDLDFTDVENQL